MAPITAMAFDPQDSAHLYAATSGQGSSTAPTAATHGPRTTRGLTDLNVVAMAIQTASPYRGTCSDLRWTVGSGQPSPRRSPRRPAQRQRPPRPRRPHPPRRPSRRHRHRARRHRHPSRRHRHPLARHRHPSHRYQTRRRLGRLTRSRGQVVVLNPKTHKHPVIMHKKPNRTKHGDTISTTGRAW